MKFLIPFNCNNLLLLLCPSLLYSILLTKHPIIHFLRSLFSPKLHLLTKHFCLLICTHFCITNNPFYLISLLYISIMQHFILFLQLLYKYSPLFGDIYANFLTNPQKSIDTAVKEMVQKFGRQRYIANLGHGMYPDMDPDHLAAFVQAVQKYSKD